MADEAALVMFCGFSANSLNTRRPSNLVCPIVSIVYVEWALGLGVPMVRRLSAEPPVRRTARETLLMYKASRGYRVLVE